MLVIVPSRPRNYDVELGPVNFVIVPPRHLDVQAGFSAGGQQRRLIRDRVREMTRQVAKAILGTVSLYSAGRHCNQPLGVPSCKEIVRVHRIGKKPLRSLRVVKRL